MHLRIMGWATPYKKCQTQEIMRLAVRAILLLTMHDDANEVAPDPKKNKRARRQKKKGKTIPPDIRQLSKRLTEEFLEGNVSFEDFTEHMASLKGSLYRMNTTKEETRTLLREAKEMRINLNALPL